MSCHRSFALALARMQRRQLQCVTDSANSQMHTIIRQPKHKFGPVLEVRQVGVFGRAWPELHNGGGLGKHAAVLV